MSGFIRLLWSGAGSSHFAAQQYGSQMDRNFLVQQVPDNRMITEITDFKTNYSLKDCVFTLMATTTNTLLMTINIRGVVKAKQT
jgi:hypothetical protein